MSSDIVDRCLSMRLWPAKIEVFRINRDEAWNEELVKIVDDFVCTRVKTYASGFKHTLPYNILTHYRSPALNDLFVHLQSVFWDYLRDCASLLPEDITPPTVNMFANKEGRGQHSIPHTHHGNQVVITYYPRVIRQPAEPSPLAGHMVFHTPTPSVPGFWARKENLFTPVKTETGTLVAFPGNAEHSTFPFAEHGSEKWALVSNWRFQAEYESDVSSYQKLDEVRSWQTGSGINP